MRRQCVGCGHFQDTENEHWWTCDECRKRNQIQRTPPLKPYVKPKMRKTLMDKVLRGAS